MKSLEALIESLRGRLFSPEKTTEIFENSRAQVHRLVKQKEIDAIKLGARTTRITGDSIAAYLERKAGVERKPVCVKKDTTAKPNPAQKKTSTACKGNSKAISAQNS